jgi:branched-chain amino acid transport system ATP-binding protein
VTTTEIDTSHAIVLHDLTKAYGGVQALAGVSLSIEADATTGIVGPNGSGKTTLFNIVSGFTRPTSGEVIYKGRVLSRMKPQAVVALGLVRTFQQRMLFERSTIRENLAVAGLAIGMSRHDMDDAIAKNVEMLDLQQWIDRSASEVPFGVARSAAIATALMRDPKVLLLDEPAAGLSDAESDTLFGSLNRVRETGVSLCIVDHNMDFLLPLCSRIVVLSGGVVIADGDRSVLEDPEVIRVYLD